MFNNCAFRKGYPDSFIKKRVSFECEWDKCSFETNDETIYFNHVHDHLVTVGESFFRSRFIAVQVSVP